MMLIIDAKPELRQRIKSLFSGKNIKIEYAAGAENIREAIEKHNPDIIIYGPNISLDKAIEASEQTAIGNPEIAIILVVNAVDPKLLRRAMQAGIKDVIEVKSTDEQILASIDLALVTSKKLKAVYEQKTIENSMSEDESTGKVITFFSTKGGVGKSVISTNVAVMLAQHTDKKVAILDLDLQFGDIAIMYQLTPMHTIYDLVQVIDEVDADMLQGFLSSHSSGIKALLAPVRPHESDSITAEHVKKVINLLRSSFDYVVIDTPPTFSDVVLTALDESDLIYLIATMDMPSIKNIKLAIQTLNQLNYPSDAIKFILNRADSRVWLEITEVEKTLGIETVARIPSDRVVPRSVNKGIPVVLEQPKSQVAKSIADLADEVIQTEISPHSAGDELRKGVRKLIGRL